jgi:hypothetical protein
VIIQGICIFISGSGGETTGTCIKEQGAEMIPELLAAKREKLPVVRKIFRTLFCSLTLSHLA